MTIEVRPENIFGLLEHGEELTRENPLVVHDGASTIVFRAMERGDLSIESKRSNEITARFRIVKQGKINKENIVIPGKEFPIHLRWKA